jgi:hypothetical protein
MGFHTSLVNPAEIAGVTRRGVSAVLQPVSTSVDVDGATDELSGTRFPVLRIVYPLSPRLVASLAYGSYLDQSWAIVLESPQVIGDRTVTRATCSAPPAAPPSCASARRTCSRPPSPSAPPRECSPAMSSALQPHFPRRHRRHPATLRGATPLDVRRAHCRRRRPLGHRHDGPHRRKRHGRRRGGRRGTGGHRRRPELRRALELAGGASMRLTPLITANAGAVWSRPPPWTAGLP